MESIPAPPVAPVNPQSHRVPQEQLPQLVHQQCGHELPRWCGSGLILNQFMKTFLKVPIRVCLQAYRTGWIRKSRSVPRGTFCTYSLIDTIVSVKAYLKGLQGRRNVGSGDRHSAEQNCGVAQVSPFLRDLDARSPRDFVNQPRLRSGTRNR